ncbi:hypothetical protein GH714_023525 [Hevea brasiliensis]|uniref:Uncharacterized protein n=1 Tax=Hevea brasiliensis TaxID=3981 RepID=A0A6A6LU78_HEVBR|nr:hypothetical protein GH714_023525 [Hevea brasiliensis]
MASSDDEADVGPQSVSNYYFVDDEDAPTSFSVLPLQWSKSESVNEKKKQQMFLHGSVDNGLQTIHKEVTAWKFDLLNEIPDISVLTKENNWIKLEKPRKSFEEIIRTVLITVHCLHFARRNPEASGKSVWDHLCKVFSLYDVRPSLNDLVDHMALISEAVRRDDWLAKSKFLLAFLEEKPRKRKLLMRLYLFTLDVKATTVSAFIVDNVDDDILEDAVEDESDEVDELFDSVCAICDNGGALLCCEGSCMRSFHPTRLDGEESNCDTLGFTRREVDAIERFLCKNCEYNQHQCFACGELGYSNKSSGAEIASIKRSEKISSGSDLLRKVKTNDAFRKSLKENTKSCSTDVDRSATTTINKTSLGDRLYRVMTKRSEQVKLQKQVLHSSELNKTMTVKTSARKLSNELPSLDAETEKRILALIKEAASSITMDDVKKKHKVPSTHAYSSKTVVDKTITTGKVEGAVEAVRTALRKLEDGCSTEDAKAVCEPEVLNQVFKWKNKLRVYLAPFLYGMRYTSFGRHFTKVEKLKENDFNFEKRDWMTVQPDELPKGVHSWLDKKRTPYDLVWEDDQFLSGKSFYLPGSVDENDKQMEQWNVTAPLLYLWSRPDWSVKHKAIAQKHDHLFMRRGGSNLEKSCHDSKSPDHPVEVHCCNPGTSEVTDDLYMESKEPNHEIALIGGRKECSPHENGDKESQDSHGLERNRSEETSRKTKHIEDKIGRGTGEKLPKNKWKGGKPSGSDTNKEVPHRSPTNVVDGRTSQEGPPSRSLETPMHTKVGENSLPNLESGMPSSHLPYGTAYGGSMSYVHEDVGSKYSMNGMEYSHGIHGFPHANLEEQSTGNMREIAEDIGYRSYVAGLERGSDMRSQVRFYGQDVDYSVQRNYLGGLEPGYGQMGPLSSIPYGHVGAAVESSYRMNMPAMQRYAPRLDELNHTRMNNFGSDPSMLNRNNIIYDSRAPRPGPPGGHVDSMGFAPGPQYPYPHSSAGWLNE